MWTKDGFADVIRYVTGNDLIPVLVGGPSVYPIAAQLQTLHPFIFNTVLPEGFAFSLSQYANIVSQSKAVVGGDSGLLHIADAVGAKVIGVYGPTDPVKFGPFQKRHIKIIFPKSN